MKSDLLRKLEDAFERVPKEFPHRLRLFRVEQARNYQARNNSGSRVEPIETAKALCHFLHIVEPLVDLLQGIPRQLELGINVALEGLNSIRNLLHLLGRKWLVRYVVPQFFPIEKAEFFQVGPAVRHLNFILKAVEPSFKRRENSKPTNDIFAIETSLMRRRKSHPFFNLRKFELKKEICASIGQLLEFNAGSFLVKRFAPFKFPWIEAFAYNPIKNLVPLPFQKLVVGHLRMPQEGLPCRAVGPRRPSGANQESMKPADGVPPRRLRI